MDDLDVFEQAVALLEDEVDGRVVGDGGSLEGAAAERRAEAAPDALERRPRFVAVGEELVTDSPEIRDLVEIAVVAGIVEEHVAVPPREEVRVGAQDPRLVEGALPEIALDLLHRCGSGAS